jgi:orotate phosphoribosyltransferase-like protein
MVVISEENHLKHYGTPRKSGRYPWGSGDASPESTRNRHLLQTVRHLRQQGMSEAEIAKGMSLSVTQLRAQKSIALAQQKQDKILTAQRLKEKGWSNVEIGKRMNLNESSVRALLAPGEKDKADAIQTTANMLKRQVDEKKYIDIGSGVEHQVGVTATRLKTSVAVLQEQGYQVHPIKVQQGGTGKYTTMKVLTPPGTTLDEVRRNRAQIRQIQEYSVDYGRSFLKTQPPLNLSSRRIAVVHGPEGAKADGMIYVRPGKKDLSIGSSPYGQVRIAVDGTHYLKGMAVYKDDLPDGVDVMFHTKQPDTGRKKDAMKPMNLNDPELPFGAITHQVHGPDGKVSSVMNLVGSKAGAGEEGAWDSWSRNLSSQMLSKQSPNLAKQQLTVTYDRRKKEFEEVKSLTNATVKKDLLVKFADQTDAASVHLKAASLPRQATKVILPISSMKPTEIYAPTMRNGENVALVRFPHGGTFEIPELTVNNRNREARKVLGTTARDAVGIHHSVAERLSGADFDGDTVLLIPNNKGLVKSTPALEDLKGFDPMVYKIPEGSPIPRVTSSIKGSEMGRVSNLITDMSLQGASSDQLARAIRHSMVVIDSEKHGLDLRKSEKDNGILALKEEYQGGKRRGASTLISQAGAEDRIPQRRLRPASRGGAIDPATGKKVFEPTGYMIKERKSKLDPVTGKRRYYETGRLVPARDKVERLAVTDDAFKLSSGTVMEVIYAEHSNRLKALANEARKESLPLKGAPTSPSAKRTYANEVASLDAKIRNAERNAPYERQAQLLANASVGAKRQANPHMEPEEIKKIKQQALNEYRNRTGAKKDKIVITTEEWNAIQAGALSTNKLEKILKNSDSDTVKMLAMPKQSTKMSGNKLIRARSMLDSGYTQAEVADALGVGVTTLRLNLNE